MYFRHVLPVNRTVSEFVPNSCRRVSRVTTTGDQTDFPKSKMASTNVSPPPCSSTLRTSFQRLWFVIILKADGRWIDDSIDQCIQIFIEKKIEVIFYFISIFFKLYNTRDKIWKIVICKFYNFHYKIHVDITYENWLIDNWYMIRNYAFQSHRKMNRDETRWDIAKKN